MPLNIKPGNALLCTINAHRSGWAGDICTDAAQWGCGAKQSFREDLCAHGDPRCYHIHIFDPLDPFLVIDHKGVGWLMADDPSALVDQVLLMCGPEFREPRGVKEAPGRNSWVYGAYRIGSVARVDAGYRDLWMLRPYQDGWARLDQLHIAQPYYRAMDGPYIKEVERSAVGRIFTDATSASEGRQSAWPTPDLKTRFDGFARQLDDWLDRAATRVRSGAGYHEGGRRGVVKTAGLGTFSELMPKISTVRAIPAALPEVGGAATDVRVVAEQTQARPDLGAIFVETGRRDEIAQNYGDSVLQALLVAALTKPIVILTGRPGVGKSHLASSLLDDPEGARKLIVPVASTWRGRDDLLGYVNPISSEFEPTAFTNFLKEAERAYAAGDRRARLVIFEEFNLSPPEFWFSEVLARSQYPPGARNDRTIDLGGTAVRGWQKVESPALFLSPDVRFVATVNSDHTTKQLSPRVLDRAALVELAIDADQAIEMVGVQIEAEQIEAIRSLDFHLAATSVTFSLRSAQSLAECLRRSDVVALTPWQAIDAVLVQEVLSKVRLLADDPTDIALYEKLRTWTEDYSAKLPMSSATIESWKDVLDQGRDVARA